MFKITDNITGAHGYWTRNWQDIADALDLMFEPDTITDLARGGLVDALRTGRPTQSFEDALGVTLERK